MKNVDFIICLFQNAFEEILHTNPEGRKVVFLLRVDALHSGKDCERIG